MTDRNIPAADLMAAWSAKLDGRKIATFDCFVESVLAAPDASLVVIAGKRLSADGIVMGLRAYDLPTGTELWTAPGKAPGNGGRNGLVVLVVLVAIGFLATIWLRRAAARYRRTLD